jgi:hypothetical protein
MAARTLQFFNPVVQIVARQAIQDLERRALARGCVEVKARRATEAAEVPVGEVAARVAALLDAGSAA